MRELSDVASQIAVHVLLVARVELPIRAAVLRVWIIADVIPGEVLHAAPDEKDEKQPSP